MGISRDNPDLFRAILAMDSYNRGYNAGVGNSTVGLGGENTGIGVATVGKNSDILGIGTDISAGFFAQSYTWAGKTVISYRGTDGLAPFSTTPSDIPHWTIAFGNDYNDSHARLAAQFYKTVKAAPGALPIELTGHSLGGALAGFVAGLYNEKATLFDPIGYMDADK
ncbi:MAG: hypothetical protein ACKVON_14200 [Beijerinckiaceae bacterium]